MIKPKHSKIFVFSQIISIIMEIFAFSFIIGGMTFGVTLAVPTVSAVGINDAFAKGCCLEKKDGSICQDMNLLEQANCKTTLLSTSCSTVDNCLKGCCYNPDGGDCSLNAPKEKCQQTGGNWSSDAMCNIQECSLGCCILGDQSSMTTSRECTKLSRDLNFERKFESLDEDGTCSTKTGLQEKGACVSSTGDYSGENNCKFGTKDDCVKTGGSFYKNSLCTAKSLNTICKPSKETTCVEGKDQVYYLDDCKNIANVYDATRFEDESYWETIIPPAELCSSNAGSASCGNCDYLTGSVCSTYRKGKDTKPTLGNNVCRNLNCANGKTHGESWCISDYSNTEQAGVSPVGSRWFMGKCLDGEISIEPCADFNQQSCIEVSDSVAKKTEAQCVINGWRSCLGANQKETYKQIKDECSKYPQCAMFYDIVGQKEVDFTGMSGDTLLSAVKNAQGYSGLPGFRAGLKNSLQGSAGDVGKDANSVIQWCLPKYTPGMVFWQDPSLATIFSPQTTGTAEDKKTEQQKQGTTNSPDYGGSYAETQGICSAGSFTCVSKQERECQLAGDNVFSQMNCPLSAIDPNTASCKDWKDLENWQCNVDGVTQTINGTDLPKLMEAMNERCRMIGPCGSSVNIAGELGDGPGFTVKRSKIDEKGKSEADLPVTAYVLSSNTLGNLKSKAGIITAGSLTSLTAAVILKITGKATETTTTDSATTIQQAQADITGSQDTQNNNLQMGTTAASLGSTVLGRYGGQSAATAIEPGLTSELAQLGVDQSGNAVSKGGAELTNLGITLVAAVAAYAIASMIAKNQNWSPGKTTTWVTAFTSTVANAVAITVNIVSLVGGTCTFVVTCVIGIVVAIIMWVYTNCIDNKYDENQYYVMEFTCETWQPPKEGNCNLCNNDIRTCSEYRCKSLGLNCQYYNDKGEPGWCAAMGDTWSAKISPWPEALTEGNKYAQVTGQGFRIDGNLQDGKVQPWQNLEFGIITDKPATCKIDNKHTKSFDDMAVEMTREAPAYSPQEAQGNTQGTYHKVALSSYVSEKEMAKSTSTLSLATGQENNYYIRCKNFAGLGNEAEFAVKIIMGDAPDLTPPYIKSFSPISGSYLGLGANSTDIVMYVDEPSECKYSIGVNNKFEQMTGTMSCLTSTTNINLGRWPCYATLSNLTADINDYYFTCKDKPGSIERTVAEKRITNENPVKYSLNVCSKGLSITSVSPKEKTVTGKSPVVLTLEAQTSGCINGGEATCYYEFASGGGRIQFSDTGTTSHKQIFDSLSSGNHNITISCEDEAGNTAQTSINVNVELDNYAPIVLKAFQANENLVVVTNENAICKYTTNSSLGCSFNYDTDKTETMSGLTNYHYGLWTKNQNYYVKCADGFGNQNLDCGIKLRTY